MEYLPEFEVKRPKFIDDAVSMARDKDSTFMAGGTDLIPNIRRGIGEPATLIDLSAISEMSQISATEDGLRIGGAVTLQQLINDPLITSDYQVIAEAANTIAGTSHRYSATVGGNLCLDTRCKFYNQSEWWRSSNDYCLKYKGDICHVAPKGKVCRATFSGDLAPSLMLHDAKVELVSAEGRRTIDLKDLYQEDGANYLLLEPGELLAAVTIKSVDGYQMAYRKTRVRGGVDFPLVGIAMAIRGNKDKVESIRIALTGTNSMPVKLEGVDVLFDKAMDEDWFKGLRKLIFSQIMPMRSTFTPAAYRRKVVVNMARKLAQDLLAG